MLPLRPLPGTGSAHVLGIYQKARGSIVFAGNVPTQALVSLPVFLSKSRFFGPTFEVKSIILLKTVSIDEIVPGTWAVNYSGENFLNEVDCFVAPTFGILSVTVRWCVSPFLRIWVDFSA